MSLLIPKANNSKLGLSHWARVLAVLLTIAVLTWYGKFHHARPSVSREHGLAAWSVPHDRGLGVLLVLPDDDNDSNRTASGLRLWLNPPREPLHLPDSGGVHYRGSAMVVLGDSLPLLTLEHIAATVDTGGRILWLGAPGWPEHLVEQTAGPRQFLQASPAPGIHDWLPTAQTGTDVQLTIRFMGGTARDYTLDVLYNGYKLRCWSSPKAWAADARQDSLSVGILLYKIASAVEIPARPSQYMTTFIWHGPAASGDDSTRIALGEPDIMALVATDEDWATLRVRKMHLPSWRPREQ